MKRIGYWISDRKSQKMKFDEVVAKCRENNIEIVKIDLDEPLEQQGPFDMLIHKFTDKLGAAEEGKKEAIQHLENFEEYTKTHPNVPVLDPVPNIKLLLDRHRQYSIVSRSPLFTNEGEKYVVPAFVDFPTSDVDDNKKRMENAKVTYPILCKPILAHGPETCHKMTLIFNDKGLKDVNPPCVAQTFIPHGAILFKLYVLGEQFSIVERPSLKNFKASDRDTIFFNSHDVSKPTSTSCLSELDDEDKNYVVKKPKHEEMAKISKAIREVFNLQLTGIDVIVDIKTGKLGVIDVNSFPGYEGTPGFPDMFCNLIKEMLDEKEKKCSTANGNGNPAVSNGSSTFQASKNGSSNRNGRSEGDVLSKQTDDQVVPTKKSKLFSPLTENVDGSELQKKTGPRSLSPDH